MCVKRRNRFFAKEPIIYFWQFPYVTVFSGTTCTEDNSSQWFKTEGARIERTGKGDVEWVRSSLVWYSVFAVLKGLFFSSDDVVHLHTRYYEYNRQKKKKFSLILALRRSVYRRSEDQISEDQSIPLSPENKNTTCLWYWLAKQLHSEKGNSAFFEILDCFFKAKTFLMFKYSFSCMLF